MGSPISGIKRLRTGNVASDSKWYHGRDIRRHVAKYLDADAGTEGLFKSFLTFCSILGSFPTNIRHKVDTAMKNMNCSVAYPSNGMNDTVKRIPTEWSYCRAASESGSEEQPIPVFQNADPKVVKTRVITRTWNNNRSHRSSQIRETTPVRN